MACILVYSDSSLECQRLGGKIRALEYDLPTLTGLALLNVDSQVVKDFALQRGIEFVPTLVMRFYDGREERLVGEEIHRWVNAVTHDFANRVMSSADARRDGKNGGGGALESGDAISNDRAQTSADFLALSGAILQTASNGVASSNGDASASSTKPRSLIDIANDLQAERGAVEKETEAIAKNARFGK